MKVRIDGFSDGKKIQAIKGLRSATGMGLKEAKAVMDEVAAGRPVEVDVPSGMETELRAHGVFYARAPFNVSLRDLMDALEAYPPTITVGELHATMALVIRGLENESGK